MTNISSFNPEIHNRKSIRLSDYDYSQEGLYFVTICCHEHQSFFGRVINGEMVLNECGRIAKECWEITPQLRKNIELGEYIIMPNHIHGIINVKCRGVLHTPKIENNQKLQNSIELKQEGVFNTPLQSPSQTIGSIIRGYKSAVTKKMKEIGFNKRLWQRNYYEHIIRNEHSFNQITEYIHTNPAKWEFDKFYRT